MSRYEDKIQLQNVALLNLKTVIAHLVKNLPAMLETWV